MTETKSRFVEENLGLVRLCANRFRGKGIEYDDLYGAGCVGLVKASGSFDSERGVKFSTYAVPVILGEIKRLFRDGGTIKVSRSLKELSVRLTRIKERHLIEHGREPSISELTELSGACADDVVMALSSSLPPISLTETSDYGDGESGGQIDVAVEAPDLEMVDILSLRQALVLLCEEDRRLLHLRYFKNLTQAETAKRLLTSQVQISRREKKLLAKLKGQLTE
ncbi:MAG: sigma-70 family RNA polymerase sigma factor [Oscillospiraceae bacterium]|nr:sigma-70 family RNA polymerase sigma factor [Oscillospiraceae bacterium]